MINRPAHGQGRAVAALAREWVPCSCPLALKTPRSDDRSYEKCEASIEIRGTVCGKSVTPVDL